ALAASGDHESRSNHQQDSTDGGRNFFALVGLNTNVDVARLDAVIFRMRNRHEKRKDSQDHHRQPHYKQSLHGKPPECKLGAWTRASIEPLVMRVGADGMLLTLGDRQNPGQTPPGCAEQFRKGLWRSRVSALR